MKKHLLLTIFLVLIGIDQYLYRKTRLFFRHITSYFYSYWISNSLLWIGFILVRYIETFNVIMPVIMGIFFMVYISKIILCLFFFCVDFVDWIYQKQKNFSQPLKNPDRKKFLTNTSIILTTLPLTTMGYGIISGAHDYSIRKTTLKIPQLPATWDGITIGQISDIHSGSFWHKTAVQGGIDMLLQTKPNIIFFTGDLVNNRASEMKHYVSLFQKIKAPLGVFSILGNHDYGEYIQWSSPKAKQKNIEALCAIHRTLKWKLLKNEHHILTSNNENIAIIGVENWGNGHFSKYGDLTKAYQGTEQIPVKILLSHDPSHWDAVVRKNFQDITLTLSGHTHGFQFGIEMGPIRWSPAQYRYPQWAGLYQKGTQYLYVNRGFGYIGYPGRIGILPEITLITLKKQTNL